jgi:hypothetical protein
MMNSNIIYNKQRLSEDEEYCKEVDKAIYSGELKVSNDDFVWFQIALAKWSAKNATPSQDPSDHQNAVHLVRRVGPARLFQNISDFFHNL